MSDFSDLTGMLVEMLSKAEEIADLLHLKASDKEADETSDGATARTLGEILNDGALVTVLNSEPAPHPLRNGVPVKQPPQKPRFKPPPKSAAPTAASLIVTRRSDGSALVRIDQGSEFTLPKALAELLLVLADRAGASDDALVPWKSLDEIGRRLGAKENKTVRRKTVITYNNRLRNELKKRAKVDRRLVQTSIADGARFALRR